MQTIIDDIVFIWTFSLSAAIIDLYIDNSVPGQFKPMMT